jgi:hypothetical protein
MPSGERFCQPPMKVMSLSITRHFDGQRINLRNIDKDKFDEYQPTDMKKICRQYCFFDAELLFSQVEGDRVVI